MLTSHRSLGLAVTIAAASCGSTATIESSWRAPSTPQLTNVVTLSPAPDGALRRSAEDKLAQQLTRHGVHAVPGYTVVNDQDLANHDQIVTTLRGQGFDGVVSMRLLDARQQLDVEPGFDDYWGNAWGATVVPETVVRIQVSAYSLASKKLVFSALSKSVDPGSASQAIGDVSKVATDKLAQEHVVAPTQAALK
jgi:hypothetical protein